MELNNIRRVSSAGYRLPERSNGTRPVKSQPPPDRTRHNKENAVSLEPDLDQIDAVKQDQMWKELVWNERRGIREW